MNLPLRNKRGEIVAMTTVDDADASDVSRWTWSLNANGYAWRAAHGQRPRHVYLHRYLGGAAPGDGLYIDHINRDRLDNRRENLRLVTPAQAAQNKPALRGRYRGVTWDRSRGLWSAQAQLDKRHHHLGRYRTEDEAAAAVKTWRQEHMPFAVEEVA